MKYDLRDRTSNFGIRIVKLINSFPRNTSGFVLGKQMIRAGTSVGANCEEADAAQSPKDFLHKLSLCLKEAKETRYWLNITIKTNILQSEISLKEAKSLLQEAHELASIFASIINKKKEIKN